MVICRVVTTIIAKRYWRRISMVEYRLTVHGHGGKIVKDGVAVGSGRMGIISSFSISLRFGHACKNIVHIDAIVVVAVVRLEVVVDSGRLW